jgi:MFS family permease
VRNYRLFFAGAVVSNTGTWMSRIAQDWLVLQLTGSPLAVGITSALQFLPMPLLGVWGGLLVDRSDKRRLLMLTQLAMAALAAVLAGLALTGVVQVWHVYAIAFGLGLVTVLDNPARQTFVNELVPRELVRNAVSLNVGNFQLARLTGPAIAGLLITAVGVGATIAVNAVTFLAVLAALWVMRTDELQPAVVAPRKPGQLREGFQYVRSHARVLWPTVMVFFVGGFAMNWPIVLTAYVQDEFAADASTYGLLNSALAVGALGGALLAARATSLRLTRLFAIAAGVGVSLVVLGATPWFVPFVVVLAAAGFLQVSFNTTANATVQLSTDPELRGRVMSLYMLVFLGSVPLGSVVIGALTESVGAPVSLMLCGVVVVMAAVTLAAVAARQAGLRPRLDLHAGPRHLVHLDHVPDARSFG